MVFDKRLGGGHGTAAVPGKGDSRLLLVGRSVSTQSLNFPTGKPGANPGTSLNKGLLSQRSKAKFAALSNSVLKLGDGSPSGAQQPSAISSRWLNKPDVVVFPDGREVCNPLTLGGQYEYHLRIVMMCVRQYDPRAGFVRCCNCRKRLKFKDATFEHEDGRTKARQDDRIAIFDLITGRLLRLINGASHGWCNAKRGSKRTPIWHGNNAIETTEDTKEHGGEA